MLKGLHARGIEPLVTLYGAPRWANGSAKPNAAPKDSRTFADFAYAAAKRYPFVRKWTIWNEPNQNLYLAKTSPSMYVKQLLNPGYAAIHRANPRALVAGGVTAPRGNSHGYGPLAWVKGLAKAHAKLDAYAHNPYPTRPRETPLAGACGYCDVISMANLGRLSKQVQRYLGKKPIWLTEYGYQTNPPDPFGVSPNLQATYIGEAAMRAYQARGRDDAHPVPAEGRAATRPLPDAGSSPCTGRRSRATPRSASRSRRSRAPARARRCGARSGPGRARGTYRLEVSTHGRVALGSARTGGRTATAPSRVAISAPKGSLVRVWSPRPARLRLADPRPVVTIARREGRHPRRRDGQPASIR